jgi:hypothetical protein
MGDSDPQVFANKVIQQMIRQIVSSDLIVGPEDYMAIRVAFRKSGGSWSDFGVGDQGNIELLKSVIKAWSEMPGRKRQSEMLV